ncbi:MAG: hypothetical protein WBB89_07960 [Candidatus Acidiferrum sp.]
MEGENVFAEEKRLKQLEQENKEKRQRRIDNLSEKYSTVDLDSALIEIEVLEKSVRFLKGGLTLTYRSGFLKGTVLGLLVGLALGLLVGAFYVHDLLHLR